MISIIIIARNQLGYLKQTIPILKSQKINFPFEIILVDNQSTDGTLEYAKKESVKLLIIPKKEFSFPKVLNKAVNISSGEVVVRLSGDVIPTSKRFLYELTKDLFKPNVAATYGRYICKNEQKRLPFSWRNNRFPINPRTYHIVPSFLLWKCLINPTRFKELRNLAGGACAFKKSLILSRPFNEKIIEGEDAEYAVFIHHIGKSISYNPKAEVIHEHEKYDYSIRNIMRNLVVWGYLMIAFLSINIYYKVLGKSSSYG